MEGKGNREVSKSNASGNLRARTTGEKDRRQMKSTKRCASQGSHPGAFAPQHAGLLGAFPSVPNFFSYWTGCHQTTGELGRVPGIRTKCHASWWHSKHWWCLHTATWPCHTAFCLMNAFRFHVARQMLTSGNQEAWIQVPAFCSFGSSASHELSESQFPSIHMSIMSVCVCVCIYVTIYIYTHTCQAWAHSHTADYASDTLCLLFQSSTTCQN